MGKDKLAQEVGGRTILQRVLSACARARRTVVVGPERDLGTEVVWEREDPPGAGPAAAVAAGLRSVDEGIVVVLAGDLPRLQEGTVARLVEALQGHDGALLTDRSGRAQHLAAAYVTGVLQDALRRWGDPAGMSMRELVEGLDLVTLPGGDAAIDVDTPLDLEDARQAGDASG